MKVWHQMFEGLYGMDEANNGYYKELAKEVVLSEDQKAYTITLQDGVKFQNGDDLKASDVVFSYKRAMKNTRFNYLTSMIVDVEAVDDSTVKITLDAPYSAIDHNIMVMTINYLSPTNNSILANDKVRQAIFHAVNKTDINLAVCEGYGDEAGYPNGVDIGTISTYGVSNGKMAQVLQANFAAVGITAAVSVMEAAIMTPKLYAQDYDICVFTDSGNYDFNNIRQQVHSESEGMYFVKYKDGPFKLKF